MQLTYQWKVATGKIHDIVPVVGLAVRLHQWLTFEACDERDVHITTV
jgi:hypothetical protein